MTIHVHARCLALLSAAALLIGQATVASAQDRFGYSNTVKRDKPPPNNVGADRISDRLNDWGYRSGIDRTTNNYSAALQFARCVARFDTAAARRLLARPIDDPRDQPALAKLARDYRACTGEISAVAPLLLRAALAETALDDTSLRASPAAVPVGIPEVVLGFPLLEVARCHLTYAPAEVQSLLKANPGTKAERTAAETLFNSVPQCASGGLGGIAPTVVRLALVEAVHTTR